MTNAILVPVITLIAVVVFHFSQLNSQSMYSGAWMDSWFLPRALMLNRWHLRGVACAALGALMILASMFYGLLDYGIFLGGALIIVDVFCSYLALRDYRRGKRRRQSPRLST
jgi:hypothetical protein